MSNVILIALSCQLLANIQQQRTNMQQQRTNIQQQRTDRNILPDSYIYLF